MEHERGGRSRAAGLVLVAAALLVLPAPAGDAEKTRDADEVTRAARTGRAFLANDRIAVILAPRRQAVLSAEVSARVTAVNRELGERFELGEVLIGLDDLAFRVNKQTSEARLEAAESNLAQVRKLTEERTRQRHAQAILDAARANLDATQRLYDDNHASRVDLENAKRDAATAQAEYELVAAGATKELRQAERDVVIARGNREIAADELDACTIEAPYDGRVARVLVNEHELVDRGTPVIEVVDDSVLLARFLLPSSLFRAVRVGQELNLTIDEARENMVVKVSHIAAVLDAASVTFEVYAEVTNPAGKLRAGMNGSLSLSEIGTQ
jgi:multidrug resistance efflux pump